MRLVHVELAEANEFVERMHRHHKRIQGHRFSIGAKTEVGLCGVAICGRPVGGQHQRDWVEVVGRELQSLRTEVASLRRDAARYRYIRTELSGVQAFPSELELSFVLRKPKGMSMACCPEGLDVYLDVLAARDAAVARESK